MQTKNGQELKIDEIMQKIREEIGNRKIETKSSAQGGNTKHQPSQAHSDTKSINNHDSSRTDGVAGRPAKSKTVLNKGRKQFVLADFLNRHDEEFLRHSYLGILQREPDPQGFEFYLAKLRKGELSKTDILGRLRYSAEGRAKGVMVHGLFLRHIVSSSFRIPIIGFIVEVAVSVLRLPRIQRNIRENYIDLYLRFAELGNEVARLNNAIARKADVMTFYWLKGQMTAKADAAVVDEIKCQLSAKADNNMVQTFMRQIKDDKFNILDQQRRLSLLIEEARKRLPEPFSLQQLEEIIKEEDHILDAMYVTFEDRFRGTREDIKGRLTVYLPYMKKINAGIENAPIVDIGCGRGEWLELLRENGFQAKGIDLNRVMISQCVELGLDVVEYDGIEYLRKQKDDSIGAVTGFHIIEHLPLRKMISLFDEAMRVLLPGGMIIFETPNPENLIVGACNFYIDPTHRRPLNPEPVNFIADQRGFVNIEIIRLHKMREIEPTGQELVDEILRRCTMEQDYAVIGYKK